jgi:RNA-directed DNA polymerase
LHWARVLLFESGNKVASKEVLVNDIKLLIAGFLAERGLALSEEKTKITHIDDGFDFLGFNHRKYKGKLLIKSSKSNTLLFLKNLRGLIKKHATIPVNDLIKLISSLTGMGELLSPLCC